MGSQSTPRVVVVTRPSAFELVTARHATVAQAAFFLETRGQSIEPLRRAHDLQAAAVQRVDSAIPVSWRRARVDRDGLARFLFEESDIVVAVGQDGLVANAAKYLRGQLVIGVNPDREQYDGVLVPHPAQAVADLLADIAAGRQRVQQRTMAEAQVDGGFVLRALNEIFVGHRTHQSARYSLRWSGMAERHSSSGVIVTTGTGATGWARSISRERASPVALPAPEEPHLAFFVREAFPSVATGCSLTQGLVHLELEIVSEMNDGGVVFGDGIEDDRIEFGWGRKVLVRRAPVALHLVQG